MKQKLLFLTLLLVASVATTNAQTKVWDFGGDPNYTSAAQIAMWPIVAYNAAEGETVKKDNLFLVGDSEGNKFGKIENSGGKTWDAGTADEYTAVNRFKFDGGSNPDENNLNPTHSHLYFNVSGPVTIKIWYRSGGSDKRELFVSDETNVIASVSKESDDAPYVLTAEYTGSGEKISIYDSNSFNLYKIEVTGAGADVLSVDKASLVTTNINANGQRIFVTNVDAETEINIFSITGALVKQIKTNSNTDFTMKPGLWIARIKTSKGEKSIKLVTY
ncbi:MAG: T9SS type A sorting domain-containing protein [Flavobacteriales bacterium]